MTNSAYASGLTPAHESFFAERPDNDEMRESFSFWFFDEDGRFGFPRIGIEREAAAWDNPRIQCNVTAPGGTVLNGAGRGPAHGSHDGEGRAAILGAGALECRCIEPFRKWRIRWDGDVAAGTTEQQIRNEIDGETRVPLRFEIDLVMAAPAWVQDNAPDKVAAMSERDAKEAAAMGIGWRLEQLVRGEGSITLGGETHRFRGTGSRIKRQSIRPLEGFRGHCWQAALFPDGRGFGYIAYPPHEDGSMFNLAYVLEEGRLYPAKAVEIPWLRRIVPEGDDVSLTLESERGTMRVEASTRFSTFRVGNPDIGGLNLHQGGALYSLDGMSAFGMIERSAHESLTAIEV